MNGFDSFAQIINESGAISLVHNGHKFIRDRVENDRSYWRCRSSFRFNCKARVVTKLMENGYEMMKIRNGEHDHTGQKVSKKSRKKSKLKPRISSTGTKSAEVERSLPFAVPTKLPTLVPKPEFKSQKSEPNVENTETFAKIGENTENGGPSAVVDPEIDIVDILD